MEKIFNVSSADGTSWWELLNSRKRKKRGHFSIAVKIVETLK